MVIKHLESNRPLNTMNLTDPIITELNDSTFFYLESYKVFFPWAHMIRSFKFHD